MKSTTVGVWHEVKVDGLPKESGYYLVTLECYPYHGDTLKTGYAYFRGKTTWAKCNYRVVAWMELPDAYRSNSNES